MHPFDSEVSAWAVEFEPSAPLPDFLFRAVTSLGKADMLILLLLLACLTRLRRSAVHGIAALVVIALPVMLIKLAVDRDRPLQSSGSFPSGDTASAVTALIPMAFASRMLAPVLIVLMALVAFFRVVAGYHYPSDVLAGAAVGLGGAWIAMRYTPSKWLRLRARLTWILIPLACVACALVSAKSAGRWPIRSFMLLVFPLVFVAVIVERQRMARVLGPGEAFGRKAQRARNSK